LRIVGETTVAPSRAPRSSRKLLGCWAAALVLLAAGVALAWQFLVPVLRVRAAVDSVVAECFADRGAAPASYYSWDIPEEAGRRAVSDLGGPRSAVSSIRLVDHLGPRFQPELFYEVAPGILGACGKEAVPDLLELVESGDRTGGMAIVALGRLGAEEAGPAIMKVLESEADRHCWPDAAEALGRLRCGEAVKRLAEILAKEPEEAPRKAAALALGRIGDSAAVPVLIAAFLDYRNAQFRPDIAEALVAVGKPALKPLEAAVAAEKDLTRRQRLKDVIWDIKNPGGRPK